MGVKTSLPRPRSWSRPERSPTEAVELDGGSVEGSERPGVVSSSQCAVGSHLIGRTVPSRFGRYLTTGNAD